ncbi:NAD-dependent epimerase/dehydratase family protein, partial [Streptomyces niveus]
MQVFITGGSGYIGRPTIQALIRHGIEVTALARSEHSARI